MSRERRKVDFKKSLTLEPYLEPHVACRDASRDFVCKQREKNISVPDAKWETSTRFLSLDIGGKQSEKAFSKR